MQYSKSKGLFFVCVLVCWITACGDSKNPANEATEKASSDAAKSSASAAVRAGDSAFAGMLASIAEQTEKQGVKIDLAKNQEALIQVLKLYLIRPDLQSAYGVPAHVDLTGLVQWASVTGAAGDADKDKLAPHSTVLTQLAQESSKVALRVKLEWR